MKTKLIFIITLLLALPGMDVTYAQADEEEVIESLELSTYYPAPYGEYDELSTENLIAKKVYVGCFPLLVDNGNMLIEGNLGIGTTSPEATLDVEGSVKIVDGTQGAGKVLTSSATGRASWQALPTSSALPQGAIIMYSGAWNFDGTGLGIGSLTGWALCNGANGTPDLSDRFVMCTVNSTELFTAGGANSYTLSIAQLPQHQHGINTDGWHNHDIKRGTGLEGGPGPMAISAYTRPGSAWEYGLTATGGSHSHGGATQATGSSNSIDNRPSYIALAFIMKK